MTVTDLLQNASYDQIVLSICAAAVAVTGMLMHLTCHLGDVSRRKRANVAERARHLRIEQPADVETPAREKAA